jgi:hypothetical protein
MTHNRAQPPSTESGAFEFEITEIGAARRALDELPPGVSTVQTLAPRYWDQRRRKPLASDRALTGAAIAWMLALPPSLRPRMLSEQYPRVVNAIAEVWAKPADRTAALDTLVTDSRGRRRGFPLHVLAEIEALRRHSARA